MHWIDTTAYAPDLSDADGDEVPDIVEVVLAEAEHTLQRQTGAPPGGLGWRSPNSDGTRGGGDELDVYLRDFSGGHLGRAPADDDAPCGGSTCSGYVELHHRIRGELLRETVAHEVNHVISYAYDYGAETWLFEATATWMSDRANDDVRTWIRTVDRWAGVTEERMTSADPRKTYGNAVWLHWLEARYGAELVREVWERTPGSDGGGSGHLPLLAFDEAVRERGGAGFGTEFSRFAAALPEWQLAGSGFEDGPHFPQVERVGTLAPNEPIDVALRPTTFALLDIAPTPAVELNLEARLPAGAAGAVALVGRAGGRSHVELAELPGGGTGRVRLDTRGGFERITAVIVNPQFGGPADPSLSTAAVRLGAVAAVAEGAAVEPPTSGGPVVGEPGPAGSPPRAPSPGAAPHRSRSPRLSVPGRRTLRRLFRSGLPITLTSDAPVGVAARLTRHSLRRVSASVTAAPARRHHMRLRLTRRARRFLRRMERRGRARVSLTVEVRLTGAAGPARTLRRRTIVTLRRGRR